MLATRGCGASHNSGQSVSSGILALLDDAGGSVVEDSLPVCTQYGHVCETESTEAKASDKEEHPGTLKESRLKDEEAEQVRRGRGSCRLSLETSGLPTVTGFLSCTSSSMLE